MAFFRLLSYFFGYSFFLRLDSLRNLLISYSLSRQLKSNGLARFQYPLKVTGHNYIKIGAGFKSGKGLRLQAIDRYFEFKYKPIINIGRNVTINPNCQITAINNITIGNNVLIASYVFISDHSHGSIHFDDLDVVPERRQLASKAAVLIGDNVWIGQGVSILPGVVIGDNVIVGANSVVTRSVPANSIVVGNPARVIKEIS